MGGTYNADNSILLYRGPRSVGNSGFFVCFLCAEGGILHRNAGMAKAIKG